MGKPEILIGAPTSNYFEHRLYTWYQLGFGAEFTTEPFFLTQYS